MEQIISRKQLCGNLSDLKNTLHHYDFSCLQNVIFLDSHAFYNYLSMLNCGHGRTVAEILSEIESCIPFALTDDSFSIFLSASTEMEEQKMEALRKGFVESCKTDFLLLLLNITDKSSWEQIVESCDCLRQKNRNFY